MPYSGMRRRKNGRRFALTASEASRFYPTRKQSKASSPASLRHTAHIVVFPVADSTPSRERQGDRGTGARAQAAPLFLARATQPTPGKAK